MTLATHIIIATAVTRPIVNINPALLFAVALLSHYLADAIPHWDYRIKSIDEKTIENVDAVEWNFSDKKIWTDILRFSTDFLVGFAISMFFIRPDSIEKLISLIAISMGAILPDVLQGIYFTRKANFLKPIQRIHDFSHSKIKLKHYPLIGVPFQLLIFFLSLFFLL